MYTMQSSLWLFSLCPTILVKNMHRKTAIEKIIFKKVILVVGLEMTKRVALWTRDVKNKLWQH